MAFTTWKTGLETTRPSSPFSFRREFTPRDAAAHVAGGPQDLGLSDCAAIGAG